MRNSFSNYKKLLSTFTYEEQINELNQKIYEVLNKKTRWKYGRCSL